MINYWSIIVAVIASIVISSIWWGPLFGKLWMRENGMDQWSPEKQAEMKKSMGSAYVQQVILSFIQAWVLSFVLHKFDRYGAVEGIKYAAIFWLGFIFPMQYANKIWGGSKSMNFVVASLASSLIVMLAMGAIVGAW